MSKQEDIINEITDLLADDETMANGEQNEIIYEIDGIEVYGGFEMGVRGIDHNILVDDNITWEDIINHGIVVVPETQTYISDEPIEKYSSMGYENLPKNNNHIIKQSSNKMKNEDNIQTFTIEEIQDLKEFNDLTIAYNDFSSNEYGRDISIDELKKEIANDDYIIGLAYTEEEDDLGIVYFEKQSSYDVLNEKKINYRQNEYIKVEKVFDIPLDEMTELLNESDFDFLMGYEIFGIDREELSQAIQLTAYTKDDQYIKRYADDNNLEIAHLDTDYIIEDRNYLLSNISEETLYFFEENNVKLSENFIHDNEYKNLSEFQLSHYENLTEQTFPPFEKIVYSSDLENDGNKKTFSNYKDLWEQEFRNSFVDDFNNFTIEELEQNELIQKANPNLLNRLGKSYDDVGKELRRAKTLSSDLKKTKERDLDNDGVSDRIDIDDTRNSVQTASDLNTVGNRTDKTNTKEEKRTQQRTR